MNGYDEIDSAAVAGTLAKTGLPSSHRCCRHGAQVDDQVTVLVGQQPNRADEAEVQA